MRRWLPLIDLVYLFALMLFVLAGVAIAPFHGDEAMQIYMSRDFETAFVDGDRAALTQGPPYFIDDDNQLRILNGTVHRYLVGLARNLIGIGRDQLMPRPGWDWGLDYDFNVETGHLPSESLLLTGRYTSALLLAFSVPVMFSIGWQIGGRPTAYLAAGLFALHPVILLNGRRAVQEGALLFFGLLSVLTGAVLAARRARGAVSWYLWPALAASCALALASKHSALPFVAGALGWVFIAGCAQFKLRRILATAAALVVTGIMAGLGFIALSPALWSDPPARIGDLLQIRQELIDSQVAAFSDGPMPVQDRIAGVFTNPFLRPPQFFEAPAWAEYEPIAQQIQTYTASPLAGYSSGGIIGWMLTAAMILGGIGLYIPRWRPRRDWAPTLGLSVWTAITVITLLLSPLDWQRYALPLLPEAVLFAAAGFTIIGRWIVLRSKR